MLQMMFFLTMYPVVFILYFVMRSAGYGKEGMYFGVHMKAEWTKDAGVKEIAAAYDRQMKKIMVVFALVPLITFFIPYFSITFSIWMMWLLVVISGLMVPYARGNNRIKARKREMNWGKVGEGLSYTEMKSAGKVRCVKPGPFLLPIVLGGAAAAAGTYHFARSGQPEIGILVLSFSVLTAVIFWCAVWMDRQKVEVISSGSEVNLNYARAKKNLWKNMWLILAWLNTIFMVFLMAAFEINQMSVVMWGCIVYTLVTLALMYYVWNRVLKVENHYGRQRDLPVEDDDDNWIWGMFYYNKSDRHVMVSRRVGIGTTMNLATPFGMGFTVFGLACIAAMPLMCVWLVMEEFTPLQLAVTDDVLTATHIRVEYEIPVSDISEIALIDEKPKWSKVNGTGMDNLCKGTFHIRNEGRCEAFLNPQNAIFLQIETGEGTYYMSAADDEETRRIYDLIAAGSQ